MFGNVVQGVKNRIGNVKGRSRSRSATLGRQKRRASSSKINAYKNIKKNEKDAKIGVLVHVKRAENLPAADANGLSDPYIKYILVNKSVSRTIGRSSTVEKTLNPSWKEDFFYPISEHNQVLRFQVWDWDRVGRNDYLGEAEIPLAKVMGSKRGKKDAPEEEDFQSEPMDYELSLVNKKTGEPAGTLFLSLRRASRLALRNKPKWEVSANDSVAKQLVVDLVAGKDLAVMDKNGKSDPYCVLSFQSRKAKSKYVRFTTNPSWQQRFDFPYDSTVNYVDATGGNNDEQEEWAENQTLTIDVYDMDRFSRPDFMGKAKVNVSDLLDQHGGANEVWSQVYLDGQPAGFVHLYVSVLNVLSDHQLTTKQRLTAPASVKVYLVQGLKTKSKGAKKVCYVEVQVGKTKLRTQPVEDSRNPTFERIVELPVVDIFSTLEITLYEKRYDAWEENPVLVGKVAFPLLEIQSRNTEWFVLKNENLTKAVNAQLRFSTLLKYHPSAYRVLLRRKDVNPLAGKTDTSLDAMRNEIKRVMVYRKEFMDGFKAVMGLLKWNYGFYPSLTGMILWVFICIFYRHWFLPAGLLGMLLYTRQNPRLYDGSKFEVDERGEILPEYANIGSSTKLEADMKNTDVDRDDEEDGESGEVDENQVNPSATDVATKKDKQTLMEKLNLPRRMMKSIQHTAETAANYYERIIGLATWSNRDLTQFCAIMLGISTVVLMFIPLNIVLLAAVEWQFVKQGLRKYKIAFVRKLHATPYNPLFEILKRVPTIQERRKYARVRPAEDIREMLSEHNFPLRKDISKAFR